MFALRCGLLDIHDVISVACKPRAPHQLLFLLMVCVLRLLALVMLRLRQRPAFDVRCKLHYAIANTPTYRRSNVCMLLRWQR